MSARNLTLVGETFFLENVIFTLFAPTIKEYSYLPLKNLLKLFENDMGISSTSNTMLYNT